MKKSTRKDIGFSIIIAAIASLVAQWFWLACEAFPPPKMLKDGTLDSVIFDDRPLVLTFNWYGRSKVFLFVCIFIYTLIVTLVSRKVWRSAQTSDSRSDLSSNR